MGLSDLVKPCYACGELREDFSDGVKEMSPIKVIKATKAAVRLNVVKLISGKEEALDEYELSYGQFRDRQSR